MQGLTQEEIEDINELNDYIKSLMLKYKDKTITLEEAEFLQAHIELLIEIEKDEMQMQEAIIF